MKPKKRKKEKNKREILFKTNKQNIWNDNIEYVRTEIKLVYIVFDKQKITWNRTFLCVCANDTLAPKICSSFNANIVSQKNHCFGRAGQIWVHWMSICLVTHTFNLFLCTKKKTIMRKKQSNWFPDSYFCVSLFFFFFFLLSFCFVTFFLHTNIK